jgi:hypothetical protein
MEVLSTLLDMMVVIATRTFFIVVTVLDMCKHPCLLTYMRDPISGIGLKHNYSIHLVLSSEIVEQ